MAINIAGSWEKASMFTLEPPLIALLLGMLLSNVLGIPRRLDAGFRVEFYVKTGIDLLGAGLPFTLILWAGPVAILQASLVSVITFATIFLTARKLGLERELAATMPQVEPSAGCQPPSPWLGLAGLKRSILP